MLFTLIQIELVEESKNINNYDEENLNEDEIEYNRRFPRIPRNNDQFDNIFVIEDYNIENFRRNIRRNIQRNIQRLLALEIVRNNLYMLYKIN